MTVKTTGIPTGGPLGGSTFTPPHYGRSDYGHRWAANVLVGETADGTEPGPILNTTGGPSWNPQGTSTTFHADDRNPHITTRYFGRTGFTGGMTHSSVWCVNLSETLGDTQTLRLPGRLVQATASGALEVRSATGVVTAANVTGGWSVIGLTCTPTGFVLYFNGVKVGTHSLNTGSTDRWGIEPTTGSGLVYFGECIAWPTQVLPDADMVAISQAMMRERGLWHGGL